ncbi:MAG TPA: DUF378 domain-containing protein [Acetobacteraceae bacterium]|nr:DUF378 domain-containing protein [Acetobacteraceae bacterium]
MRALNTITLILIIIGGLNWGLVGIANFNLVGAIFGGTGIDRVVYIIVGLSALSQLVPLGRTFSVGEVDAERGVADSRYR